MIGVQLGKGMAGRLRITKKLIRLDNILVINQTVILRFWVVDFIRRKIKGLDEFLSTN